MTEQTDSNCESLRQEIDALQSRFEKLWLAVSGGDTAKGAEYRQVRHQLDELRARYGRECGEPHEGSSLPKSILSSW